MTISTKDWADINVPPGMTEEEFVAWRPPDVNAEFVDGKVSIVSPVSPTHDRFQAFLRRLLDLYLEHCVAGVAFGPELWVRLRAGLLRLPDVGVLVQGSDARLAENRVEGAPDLVMEIVSPESVDRDWRDKYLDYQEAGVQEYWIVDPQSKVVHLYRLDDAGSYQRVEEEEGRLLSQIVPGFWIRVDWLWQETPPDTLACLKEILGVEHL